MKNAAVVMLAGAIVGVVVASLIVPPLLGWYAAPGGLPQGAQVQAVVQIPEVIRYATSRLLLGQTIGAGLGAAAGLVVYLLWRSGRAASRPAPRPDGDRPPAR
jgi:hypothetical protein